MALHKKMITSEETLQYFITAIGLVLIMGSYGLAAKNWYLAVGLSACMIVFLIGGRYLMARKLKALDRTDERTARMTQLASRSGYLAALLGIATVAVLTGAGYVKFGLEALMWLYVAVVIVQAIAYAYYLDRGLT